MRHLITPYVPRFDESGRQIGKPNPAKQLEQTRKRTGGKSVKVAIRQDFADRTPINSMERSLHRQLAKDGAGVVTVGRTQEGPIGKRVSLGKNGAVRQYTVSFDAALMLLRKYPQTFFEVAGERFRAPDEPAHVLEDDGEDLGVAVEPAPKKKTKKTKKKDSGDKPDLGEL